MPDALRCSLCSIPSDRQHDDGRPRVRGCTNRQEATRRRAVRWDTRSSGQRFAGGLVLVALLASGRVWAAAGSGEDAQVAGAAPSPTAATGSEATDFTPSPFMRVVDVDDHTMRLDMGIRLYLPSEAASVDDEAAEGSGEGHASKPVIALAGAVHIADPTFYSLLQAFLDAQDVVLYEGVKPRGMGRTAAELAAVATAEAAAAEAVPPPGRPGLIAAPREQTADRMRFLAALLEQHRSATGEYPADLNELSRWVADAGIDRVGQWTSTAATDAWGQPLVYTAPASEEDGFGLVSYGADAAPGGTGEAADVDWSAQPPLSGAELGEDEGIQTRMARALGLQFQLEGMRHDRPHYINSDLALDEVEREIVAEGGDPETLIGVIDGRSMMARIANFSLAIIERSPKFQAMAKIGLMEALRMLEGGDIAEMPGLPPSMQAVMRVIVRDRNEVVMSDLASLLRGEPVGGTTIDADGVSSIAIVYGAGHMADLERRIVEELGYRPAGVIWLTAMEGDLETAGMTQASLRMLRSMMSAGSPFGGRADGEGNR